MVNQISVITRLMGKVLRFCHETKPPIHWLDSMCRSRPAHSWHSLLSQYSQLGVAVQLAPGFAAQNAAEQSLLGAGGGGVGGEQSLDGRGTLKV